MIALMTTLPSSKGSSAGSGSGSDGGGNKQHNNQMGRAEFEKLGREFRWGMVPGGIVGAMLLGIECLGVVVWRAFKAKARGSGRG